MYIRKASRTVHGKTYFNYLLVERHLTPKGPRQKVVCSLGDLSPRPPPQWLELARKLEHALSGRQELFASASPDPALEALVAKVKTGPRRRRPPASNPARKRSPS